MEGALALQQTVVQAPPLDLARGGVADELRVLAQRLGIPGAGDGGGTAVLESILDRLLAAGLSSWIVDWCVTVCADAAAASDDPEATRLLSGEAVAAWCGTAADRLGGELEHLICGDSIGDDEETELSRIASAAGALLHVTRALSAPAIAAPSAPRATQRLQLLAGAAAALEYCVAAGCALQAASPAFASRAAWGRAISARRAAVPSGRIFLDDAIDAVRIHQPLGGGSPAKTPRGGSARGAGSVAAAGYPWATPAAAVGALFLVTDEAIASISSSSGSVVSHEARHARLALLRYFLVDGGWAGAGAAADESPIAAALAGQLSHGGFARAFDLPPGLVAQAEACALLDRALGGADAGSSGSASVQALDAACALLLASANAATPFRVVEALASAGRPAQALAVQRARGTAAAGGALQEAAALLAARLEMGLLQEAHGGVALHCAQLRSAPERLAHLRVLMGQLLDWAGTCDDARRQAASSDSSTAPPVSWLQRVAELPLGAEEEAVVAAWLEARAARGQGDGDLQPLLLLQRGRSLEALAAYARWRDSPAAAAAPTNAAAAARPTQLRALMATVAAALLPALRGGALVQDGASSGTTARRLVAGLGTQLDAAPPALLVSRGAEPPAFLAPVVSPCGAAGAATAESANDDNCNSDAPPVLGVTVAAPTSFADAPPSAMMMDASDSAAASVPDAVVSGGLLFGVPAPAGSLFGAPTASTAGGSAAAPPPAAAAAGGLLSGAGGSGGGSLMGTDEFMTQVMGMPPPAAAAGAGASGPQGAVGRTTRSSTRSSKRQRH